MTYPAKHLQQSISLINKDLALEQPLPTLGADDDASAHKQLRHWLTGAINYLLDKNMSQLLNALYRMDVNEFKVKNILAVGEPGKIGEALADLIIERAVQKVLIREKYSSL